VPKCPGPVLDSRDAVELSEALRKVSPVRLAWA
jgi:hypothetical protein